MDTVRQLREIDRELRRLSDAQDVAEQRMEYAVKVVLERQIDDLLEQRQAVTAADAHAPQATQQAL